RRPSVATWFALAPLRSALSRQSVRTNRARERLAAKMFPFDLLNLGQSFKKSFEVVPAVSAALRDEAFRIRHQVYCEELGFEPSRPDGREADEYDAQSLHCLIRSRRSDEFVGCTRLILCRRSD